MQATLRERGQRAPTTDDRLCPPPFSPLFRYQVPNATFSALHIKAGSTVTIRLAMAVADDEATVAATASSFSADLPTFRAAFAAAHSKWEERWQQAFAPRSGYWSGNLPTLALPGGGVGADVERVYYMSALTVVSQMRTNLPLLGPRVW